MRHRSLRILVGVVVALLVFAAGSWAEIGELEPPNSRDAELLAALSQSTYTAKRDIPAADGIFVEGGWIIEILYDLARQDYETAVRAGESTEVSDAEVLDGAVQVYFAEDECSLIIIPKEAADLRKMSMPRLIEVVRDGVSKLFAVKEKAKAAENKAPTSVAASRSRGLGASRPAR